jgi:putative transposase
MEHELEIITGKVASDHIHLFIAFRPTQDISKIMQGLKGLSSSILFLGFPLLKKRFWKKHLWSRGYLAVWSGSITDKMIQLYSQEQEGGSVTDQSRFQVAPL